MYSCTSICRLEPLLLAAPIATPIGSWFVAKLNGERHCRRLLIMVVINSGMRHDWQATYSDLHRRPRAKRRRRASWNGNAWRPRRTRRASRRQLLSASAHASVLYRVLGFSPAGGASTGYSSIGCSRSSRTRTPADMHPLDIGSGADYDGFHSQGRGGAVRSAPAAADAPSHGVGPAAPP